MELVADALKMERGEMEEMFEDGMQAMRMNYYPPCPEPDKVMGLTPHSDASGITILLQVNGVEGFQVKRDGVWLPLKFLPNAFVVNLGDAVEVRYRFCKLITIIHIHTETRIFMLVYM